MSRFVDMGGLRNMGPRFVLRQGRDDLFQGEETANKMDETAE